MRIGICGTEYFAGNLKSEEAGQWEYREQELQRSFQPMGAEGMLSSLAMPMGAHGIWN